MLVLLPKRIVEFTLGNILHPRVISIFINRMAMKAMWGLLILMVISFLGGSDLLAYSGPGDYSSRNNEMDSGASYTKIAHVSKKSKKNRKKSKSSRNKSGKGKHASKRNKLLDKIDKVKVAFVFGRAIPEAGRLLSCYDAQRRVEKTLKSFMNATFITIPADKDPNQVITELGNNNFNLIFTANIFNKLNYGADKLTNSAPLVTSGSSKGNDKYNDKKQDEDQDDDNEKDKDKGREAEEKLKKNLNRELFTFIATMRKFPQIKFVNLDPPSDNEGNINPIINSPVSANLSWVGGQIEVPFYVAGMLAGKMTKTNKLGIMAGIPTPESYRIINAFTLGAQKTNSNIKTMVIWTHSSSDKNLAKGATLELLKNGHDIIAQDLEIPGTGTQKAIELYAGLAGATKESSSDLSKIPSKIVLTSAIYKWSRKFTEIVQQIVAENLKQEAFWGDWNDGVVDLAPLNNKVPEAIKEMIREEIGRFKSGEKSISTIFTGEIKDNSGKVRIPSNATIGQEELWKMNWLVEGIEEKTLGPKL